MERAADMTEHDNTIEFMTLDAAEGSIEAGPEQQERLEEFTERVGRGEFHVEIEQFFPCTCIDDRAGGAMRGPNTAGGTLSLLAADDLTTKSYQRESSNLLDANKNLVEELRGNSLPVGWHRDTHAHGNGSGCGAADKIDKSYEFMASNPKLVRGIAESLGVDVSDELHELLIAGAMDRADFPAGGDLIDEFENDEAPVLEGDHTGVVAVVNTVRGTTLDREKVEAEFGTNYRAFNVDVWALPEAAAQISENDVEAEAKFVAMVYFNLAVTHALTGKKMRVVVV